MSNTDKIMAFALVAIVLLGVAYAFLMNKPKHENDTSSDTKPFNSNENISSGTSTIANQWQWQELEKRDPPGENQDTPPFTPQSVHDALQAVNVNESGDVVIDHDTLISLDEALERIHNRLDGESLGDLQDLIKQALPGKVGEQTAQLVGDYQQFLKAKEAFDQIHSNSGSASGEQTIASIQNDQALYAELQTLREVHLGEDVADRLFQVSDANAEFMFDSIKLDLDTSLSAEEKQQRRREIEARLERNSPPGPTVIDSQPQEK